MQRFLLQLALGDVGHEAIPQRGATGLALGDGVALYPANRAVWKQDTVFVLPGSQVVGRLAHRHTQAIPIIRVHHGQCGGRAFAHVFQGQAINVFDGLTRIGKAGTAVQAQTVLVHHAGQAAGHFLKAAQSFLLLGVGLLDGGNFPPHALVAGDNPFVVVDGDAAEGQPVGATGAVRQANFKVVKR